MNNSANNAQNSNLKRRTKQLSAAARAIQTRKRDMLTELYYARALLMDMKNDNNTASALKRIDHAIKIGEM